MQSDIHRSEYWPKLTEYLIQIDGKEYTKDRKDMYQVLRPFLDVAVTNAKRLDVINTGKPASLSAPGTKVYELIDVLRTYL